MNFTKNFIVPFIACIVATGTAQAAIDVSYNGEAVGVENSTASFTFSAVETFDSQPVQSYPHSISQTFTDASHPTTTITMGYTGDAGIRINSADQHGGAGGNSNYIVAHQSTPYTLNLSSTNLAGGVNYFGYWLSALDAGNQALFYDQSGRLLLTFSAKDVLGVLRKTVNSQQYYGNPNAAFKGQDGREPFVFLNFFDTSGSLSKVVFKEAPTYNGGYESDNHTAGHYVGAETGVAVPLTSSIVSAVPETATWTMMLVGFAGLGLAMRARRQQIGAFA